MKFVKIIFAAVTLVIVGLIFNSVRNEQEGILIPISDIEKGPSVTEVDADISGTMAMDSPSDSGN